MVCMRSPESFIALLICAPISSCALVAPVKNLKLVSFETTLQGLIPPEERHNDRRIHALPCRFLARFVAQACGYCLLHQLGHLPDKARNLMSLRGGRS